MLVVGLTGGIGSGKSTVAELFHARGVPVADADEVSRELVMPGSVVLKEIASEFGDWVITADGRLDRRALRARVFADPATRERLESILHPRILAELARWVGRQRSPYVIQMIPLLVEKGLTGSVDRVLVADCLESEQIERVMQRDDCTRQQVEAILQVQAHRPQRLAVADDVIRNHMSADLAPQVDLLHGRYLRLSAQE